MADPTTQTTKRPLYDEAGYPEDDGRPKMTKTITTKLEELRILRALAVAVNDLYPWADRNSHRPLRECRDEFSSDKERKAHHQMMKKAMNALERFDRWQRKQ